MHRGARALRSGAGPLVGLAPGGAHPHRMKHALQVDVGRSVPPCDNILSEPNWARASERSGRHQPEVRFSDWGARWLDSLERKPLTVTSQGPTIAYAKKTFGARYVEILGPDDLAHSTESCAKENVRPRRARSTFAAQTRPGKERGSLPRERGTSASIRRTQRRELQDVVFGCTQARDTARRTVCSSLG